MKGRVEAFKDEFGEPIGPLRVWVQGDNVPGLAMTKLWRFSGSFGWSKSHS